MRFIRKSFSSAVQGIRKCLTPITLLTATILTGCELAYKQQVKDFINKSVEGCGGSVGKLALVQDGANKLTGLAEVTVDGVVYKTTVSVKTGIEDSIITIDDDVCSMHNVRNGLKALQEIFK